jgi:predicted phage terminase large subunit-like protein
MIADARPGGAALYRGPVSQHRLLQALLRTDLASFIAKIFAQVAPGVTYLSNWHINAIAWYLQLVAAGQIKRLLITMPPRSLKSIATSVAFPAWILGRDPSRRVVCISYASELAVKHANDCRAVMEADWYQALFPRTRIHRRKNTEHEVRTSQNGYRLATTTGGTLTGRGGNIIIIDDPIKASEAASEQIRAKVNAWFDESLLSRLDNKTEDAIILVMQRLHVDDLAGHVLQKGGWVHLNLPAISEFESSIQTGPNQHYLRRLGEVLHQAREPKSVLDELKIAMGSSAFSAQYQQAPVPPGGNMIRWEWFETYAEMPPLGPNEKIVTSWDTASKPTELADYTVGITFQTAGEHIFIRNVVRERLDYPSLVRRVLAERERWKPTALLIEDKGSGTSLIQDLRSRFVPVIPILPEGDKIIRMSAQSAVIESGAVYLPKRADWLDDFRAEIIAFPYGQFDDQVDALSQGLRWITGRRRSLLELL